MNDPRDEEPDWFLWFEIEPEDFDSPDWVGPDDPDGFFPDPRMAPVPYRFVQRLRGLIPRWREFGLGYQQTGGIYQDGRVWVLISIGDQGAGLSLGSVRVDLTDSEWIGSWVQGGNANDAVLQNAEPLGEPVRVPFSDPEHGIEGAIGWMIEQLTAPIMRRVWRRGERVIAESWTFENTGNAFVVSGDKQYWSRPETADEVVRVHG